MSRPAHLWTLLCVSIAVASTAQPSAEEWRVERTESTWKVAPTGSVEVVNPHGNIVVRAVPRDEVFLLVNAQRHRDDPRSLDLRVLETPDSLSLELGFTAGEGDDVPDGWTKRRIDVTVFVPPSATTRFETHTGSVEIRGTRGATAVESWSGDLRLRLSGAVTAKTEHGDVLAQFLRTDWDRPVEIASRTGEIRVEMPAGGRAEVVLETRGEITSDYSTEIERLDGSLLKRARLSVGDGGPPLRLESYQGPIKVLQSLVPVEDQGGR